ncbi:MAG TPA: hypothetical protein VG797_11730, partial [Phycisphaerales bacterium]|nr:hypothetical protein [Phycisphaerales bacterium]
CRSANTHAMSLAELKARRRRRILQILQKEPVSTQQDLLRYLHADSIPATQATISRDLRALGAVRSPTGYVLPGGAPNNGQLGGPDSPALREAVRQYLLGVDRAGTIVILRTAPGHAGALATEVDAARLQPIVGTIAGDDTMFAACRSNAAASGLLRQFRDMAASL